MEADKLLKQAEHKLRHGDFAGAQKDSTSAIKADPSLAKAYFVRSNARLARGGKIDEVIEDLTEAVRLKPNFAEAYFMRGVCYRRFGRSRDGIADFSQVIAIEPKFSRAYNMRGGCKLDSGDPNGSISDYNTAIQLAPRFASAYYGRGSAWRALGHLRESLADFTKVIKLLPKAHAAYFKRGVVHVAMKNSNDAIADFSKAIELEKNYAAAYNNRGIAKVAKGDLDAARRDFSSAIARNRQYAMAYYNRGAVKFRISGKGRDALGDWRAANGFDSKLKNEKLQLWVVDRCAAEDHSKELTELLVMLCGAVMSIPNKPKNLKRRRSVMHYTNRNALKSLARGKRFRIMDAAGMRDPFEGKYFSRLLLENVQEGSRAQVENLVSNAGKDTYVGSFVTDSDEVSGDDMMWRLYGRHRQTESAGCALVFDVAVFAKDPSDHLRLHMARGFVVGEPTVKQAGSEPVAPQECYLFEVQYGSALSGVMKSWIRVVAELLQQISTVKDAVRAKDVVSTLLGPCSYRFKSRRYKRECEARIMVWRRPDSGEHLDVSGSGRKYLECPSSIRPKKVILGPAINGAEAWRQWLLGQPAFEKGVRITEAAG